MRSAVGLRGSGTFCLGIEELAGHPEQLALELRVFDAFAGTFRAQVLSAFLELFPEE